MRTWRRARVVAIALTLAHLVGCGGASNTATNERQRPLIGVSLLTQSHTFYKDLEAALRTEAATRGLDLNVVACEMDPARQASQIEDFIAQKVAAILVAPCDSSAVVPHLKAAQQAGIPVFSADIAGIFAINDDSALGAVAVLKAANRNDVVIVGFDATDEAVNMIRAGSQLKADIAQYPKKIGQMSIEHIARHLQGEKVPAVVPVPVDVVNQERLTQQ